MLAGEKKQRKLVSAHLRVVELARQDNKPGNLSRARNALEAELSALFEDQDSRLRSLTEELRQGVNLPNIQEILEITRTDLGRKCETIVEEDDSETLVCEVDLIREKTVREIIQEWIREPVPSELLAAGSCFIGGKRIPARWVLTLNRKHPFFSRGLSDKDDPKWLSAERFGIEILEREPDTIEEAFWHPEFPILLKARHHRGIGWLCITPARIVSQAAQFAANRVCERCGWPVPFPGVSGEEPTTETKGHPRSKSRHDWSEVRGGEGKGNACAIRKAWQDFCAREGTDRPAPEVGRRWKARLIREIASYANEKCGHLPNDQQIRNWINLALKTKRGQQAFKLR